MNIVLEAALVLWKTLRPITIAALLARIMRPHRR